MELEDRLTLPSAEGIDLDLSLAGIGSRGVALLVDLALQTVVLFLAAAAGSALSEPGVAFYAIVSFLVLLGYPILAEAFTGRTVGKRLLRLTVLSTEGTPVTFLAATIRNVVRFVDALPGTYFVGLTSILLTSRNQRVGDLAAGTLVVHDPHRRPADGRGGAPASPGWPMDDGEAVDRSGWDVSAVTSEEVSAARSFLLRRDELDPRHRADLAQTLAFQLLPKVAGVPLEGGPERFLERIVRAKTAG